MQEFDLIARIRARVLSRSETARDDVIVGIGDDAALLSMPAGKQLVVAMDTLNAGVHFPVDTAPRDIGWKALAVNVSDLAAMAAEPAWCTLSLSLPDAEAFAREVFVDGFLDGFLALAAQHRIALIGGDTTRGPLSISVTVHGFVAPGGALRRDAARVHDDVWVTGTLGDAAAALLEWQEGRMRSARLRARLDTPTPRIAAGRALAGIAHACIDISDGLAADLAHVCRASGVGAEILLDALPASQALCEGFAGSVLRELQTCGGDDYELCFTAPITARLAVEDAMSLCDVPVTRIGCITGNRDEMVFRDSDGNAWLPPRQGYVHFS